MPLATATHGRDGLQQRRVGADRRGAVGARGRGADGARRLDRALADASADLALVREPAQAALEAARRRDPDRLGRHRFAAGGRGLPPAAPGGLASAQPRPRAARRQRPGDRRMEPAVLRRARPEGEHPRRGRTRGVGRRVCRAGQPERPRRGRRRRSAGRVGGVRDRADGADLAPQPLPIAFRRSRLPGRRPPKHGGVKQAGPDSLSTRWRAASVHLKGDRPCSEP